MGLPGKLAQVYVESNWLNYQPAPTFPAGNWEHLQRLEDIRINSDRNTIGFRPRGQAPSDIVRVSQPSYHRATDVEFTLDIGYRKHIAGDLDYDSLVDVYRNGTPILVLVLDRLIDLSVAMEGWQFPAIITDYQEAWPLGGAQLSRFELMPAWAIDNTDASVASQIILQRIEFLPLP